MQPRRDTQHTPYGETQNPAEDRLEEEAYQPVKPWGMRHAWPLSRNGLPTPGRGVQGRRAPQHTGYAGLWPQGPYAPANGPRPGQPRGQAPYTGGQPAMRPPAPGPAYRQPVVSKTQPYPPQQARGPQRNGQQPWWSIRSLRRRSC